MKRQEMPGVGRSTEEATCEICTRNIYRRGWWEQGDWSHFEHLMQSEWHKAHPLDSDDQGAR